MNPMHFSGLYGFDRRAKILVGSVCLLMLVLITVVFGLLAVVMQAAGTGKARELDTSAAINSGAPMNVFARWQPADIVTALQESGLDVEALPSGKNNDELGAFLQVGEQRFRARVGSENVEGFILTFFSNEDLVRMENYYRALNHALPAFKSRVFVRDNVLLEVNGNLTEYQAKRFEQALGSIPFKYWPY